MELYVIDALSDVVPLYPLVLPQGATLPSATFQRITSNFAYSHDGDSNLVFPLTQISIYALTMQEVRDIADSIRAVLSGVRDGDFVTFVENLVDGIEPETGYYKTILTISGSHKDVVETSF